MCFGPGASPWTRRWVADNGGGRGVVSTDPEAQEDLFLHTDRSCAISFAGLGQTP